MKLTIVGIHGYKEVGKDTVADYLVEKYGFIKVAFADRIKELCSQGKEAILDFLPWVKSEDLEQFSDVLPWNGQKDERGRKLLQYVGTEFGRDFEPNVWINELSDKVRDTIDSSTEEHIKIVVPDLRFICEEEGNEMQGLLNIETIVCSFYDISSSTVVFWKIIRKTNRNDSHRSEAGCDIPLYPFDVELDNNRTKEELYVSIDAYIKEVIQ